MFSGGFGNGKTWTLILRAFMALSEPGNRILVGRKHLPDLRGTTLVDWWRLMPTEWLRGFNKSEMLGETKTGSTFRFRPLNDDKALGSYTLGFVGIDEAAQVPEASWKQLRNRMRLDTVPSCHVAVVSNPEGPDHYLYDAFVNPRTRKPGYSHHSGSSLENIYTPLEFRDSLLQSYPEGPDRERFVHGAWLAPEGQIWGTFKPDRNIIPYKDLLPLRGHWIYDRSIDFGFHHDFVCLFCAWDYEPDGGPCLIVLREYFASGKAMREHGEAIWEIGEELRADGFRGDWDTTWADHDAQDRFELQALEVERHRIVTQPARKSRAPGLRSTKFGFLPGMDGYPRIYYTDRCPKLASQTQGYRRPEGAKKEDDVVEFNEKGVSIVDGCDAARYVWFSRAGEAGFVRQVGYQPGMDEMTRHQLHQATWDSLETIGGGA